MTVEQLKSIYAERKAASHDAEIRSLTHAGLTDRQAEIYLFVFNSALETGIQPTLRGIGERFSISSPNGVVCHVRAIAKKGWWEQDGSESFRSLRFLRQPSGEPFRGFVCR